MKKKGKNCTVHFSAEIDEKLSMLAKQKERSKGFFIKKAVDAFLRDLEEEEEDYKLGLESLEEYKKTGGITLDEYIKKYNLDSI